jgi:hypothetical protein
MRRFETFREYEKVGQFIKTILYSHFLPKSSFCLEFLVRRVNLLENVLKNGRATFKMSKRKEIGGKEKKIAKIHRNLKSLGAFTHPMYECVFHTVMHFKE